MGDGLAHMGHKALPPAVPYSFLEESATYPSPVDVRSTMEMVAPTLSSSHRAA